MEIKNDFIDGQEVLAGVEELNKEFSELLDKARMDGRIPVVTNMADSSRILVTVNLPDCQIPTFKIDQEQMEEAKKMGERMRKEMQDAVDHLNYTIWRKEMVAQGYKID
jgi:hypothetical protein